METTADEINEGLAKYMEWTGIEWHGPDFLGGWWGIEPGTHGPAPARFTDSLDACERVIARINGTNTDWPEGKVTSFGFALYASETIANVHIHGAGGFANSGPTRSHALAAALWAAVKEQGE